MDSREPIFSASGNAQHDEFMKRAYRHFLRHAVCITANARFADGREDTLVATGFVVAVGDQWMISTAGHFLKFIDEDVKGGLVRLSETMIATHFGPDAKVRAADYFPLVETPAAYLDNDESGLDFGFIFLSDYVKAGIAANNVVPITEDNWTRHNRQEFDGYFLVGFPKEIADRYAKIGRRGYAPVMISVEKTNPAEPSTPYPRFEGRLTHPIDFSLQGMSGGPIIGVRQAADGIHLAYSIVAMQSSWNRKDRIFGCPVKTYGDLMLEALERTNPGRQFKRY
jgi:hypothetical protein